MERTHAWYILRERHDRPGFVKTGVPAGLPILQALAGALDLVASKQRRGYQVVGRGRLYLDH